MSDNLTDKKGTPVSVSIVPQGGAYGIYFDWANEEAGATHFIDRGQERIFFHTIVGEENSGRGLAGILVESALEDTNRQGITVVPVCPFVRSWTEKKAWSGLLRQPTQEDIKFVMEHSRG